MAIYTLIFMFSNVAIAEKKLMIFGGSNQDVYLGCLNCSELSVGSVLNNLGEYGSDLSMSSIFNELGTYGSNLSMYSPCNDLASNPLMKRYISKGSEYESIY